MNSNCCEIQLLFASVIEVSVQKAILSRNYGKFIQFKFLKYGVIWTGAWGDMDHHIFLLYVTQNVFILFLRATGRREWTLPTIPRTYIKGTGKGRRLYLIEDVEAAMKKF